MVEYYDVCVICALPKEAKAFMRVVESHGYKFEPTYSKELQRDYFHTSLQNNVQEQLQIMVTWLPNMGAINTVSDFLSILQNFRLRFAAMTGICAGDKKEVKLGDIIVAERTYISDSGSFIIDDNDEREQKFDITTISLSNDILHFVRGFEGWENEGFQLPRPPSKHQQRDWLLSTLLEKKSIRAIEIKERNTHAPKWRDLIQELQQAKTPFLNSSMELINIEQVEELFYGIEEFPYIDPPTPKCHIAPMASSNAVHKDRPFPDISKPVRKVLGLDMESMAFYHTLQERHSIRSLVVKGVSDYADVDKDDSYQDYAATLSAIYAYNFIKHFVTNERMPWPTGKNLESPTTVISNQAVPQATIPTTQATSVEKPMNSNNAGTTDKKTIKIFVSCSESSVDADLIKRLDTHFALLKRQIGVKLWYRSNILAGDVSQEKIEKNLNEADIILLLLTPNYLAESFYDEEYGKIQIRSTQGTLVIPILLKSVDDDWIQEFYGKFQPLPHDKKPVDEASSKDTSLTNIVRGIKQVINTTF
jgi:nucleoside phosphorylase